MKSGKEGTLFAALLAAVLLTGCLPVVGPAVGDDPFLTARAAAGGGGGGGKIDLAVNNLSYPVLWADDPMASFAGLDGGSRAAAVTKLTGEWWYWLGIVDDAPVVLYPSPETQPEVGWLKAFEQQDPDNVWTADAKTWAEYTGGAALPILDVTYIDWGDNLESVDWSVRSKVRTEVVLYKLVDTALKGYNMLHIRDLGIDEMHGLEVGLNISTVPGEDGTIPVSTVDFPQPIVYTNHARLTIQKLITARDDPRVDPRSPNCAVAWAWDPVTNAPRWQDTSEANLIDEVPIHNYAVYDDVEAGPGGYSAEVNVKGRIVYGYTWDTREDGLEVGDYRITFSLDPASKANLRGASILLPLETETATTAAADEGATEGGAAVVSPTDNLTYIDIHLIAAGGGSSK